MNEKKVYQAIAAVTEKLSKEGISKARKNTQQGYAFRGIDDVYNALAPFLAEAKLCILPKVESREVVERESRNGGVLFYVTVKVDFAFVSAEDGSEHHVVTFGEAMDSGDKATNKAMSAAYKYACMQAFCIPTEGDNDADLHTHEVKPGKPAQALPAGSKSMKSTAENCWDELTPEQQKEVQMVADCVMAEFDKKGAAESLDLLRSETVNWEPEYKAALTSRFPANIKKAWNALEKQRKESEALMP